MKEKKRKKSTENEVIQKKQNKMSSLLYIAIIQDKTLGEREKKDLDHTY